MKISQMLRYAEHVRPTPNSSTNLSRSRILFKTNRFMLLFVLSLSSALLGAELVHRIMKPNVEIPHLPPDFEGLRKERESKEKGGKLW